MKTTNWRPATDVSGGYWVVTRDTLRKALTDRGREMAHGYVQKHKYRGELVKFPTYAEALAKADQLNRVAEPPLCSCGVPGCQGVEQPAPELSAATLSQVRDALLATPDPVPVSSFRWPDPSIIRYIDDLAFTVSDDTNP